MQADFHYYATYCAAYLAGYSHEESLETASAAQLVDRCSRNYLSKAGAPLSAATSQFQIELVNAGTDFIGLQDITRIWASFHFLPGDLYAQKKSTKLYRAKYRLICNPNGALLADTVNNAKGKSLQTAGIAMHVLADTWAHRYFAGTPSFAINNTNYCFYEIINENGTDTERKITFRHSASVPDDIDASVYSSSIGQPSENTIMNLGHGRAGHLPDYSFARYRYMPSWGDYDVIVKDNPVDYYNAFCQMVYALRYLRGDYPEFRLNTYDTETVAPYEAEIKGIISKRQLIASDDWKAFGEKLSGKPIPDFEEAGYQEEYAAAKMSARSSAASPGTKQTSPARPEDSTVLGRFVIAALSQKSLVTNKIFRSGSLLAGVSVDFREKGFKGMKDYMRLVESFGKGEDNE